MQPNENRGVKLSHSTPNTQALGSTSLRDGVSRHVYRRKQGLRTLGPGLVVCAHAPVLPLEGSHKRLERRRENVDASEDNGGRLLMCGLLLHAKFSLK